MITFSRNKKEIKVIKNNEHIGSIFCLLGYYHFYKKEDDTFVVSGKEFEKFKDCQSYVIIKYADGD